MPRASVLVAVVLGAVGFACSSSETTTSSSTSSSGGSSGSSSGAAATDCPERCAKKAKSCGAPDGQVSTQCASLCADATSAKVDCLESSSCAELAAGAEDGSVCSGSSSSSSSSSGSSGGQCIAAGKTGCDVDDPTKKCCGLGVACDTGTRKCCVPINQPMVSCTTSSECCTGSCQTDPDDASKKYCQ